MPSTTVLDAATTRVEPGDGRALGWGYGDVAAYLLGQLDFGTPAAPLRVLEAGGGSASHLPLPFRARVTTIDISAEALAMNTEATEKLLGDLQTFDYGTRRYDLIVCWDVLEHLQDPAAALARFTGVLEPGGRIVLVGPLPSSFKGWITRLTPHWVHVQFYRWVLGSVMAGEPGHPPFETQLTPAATPREIGRFLAARGLDIATFIAYESHHVTSLGRKSRWLLSAYRCVEWMAAAASFGRVERGVSDFVMIAVKSR